MQKLIFVVAVIAAVAACKPAEDKPGMQRSEVERRAEVQDSQKRMAEERAADGRMPDATARTPDDAARMADEDAKMVEKREEATTERANFAQKAMERLNTAEAKIEAVIQKAPTSTKGKPVADAVVQDATLLKQHLVTLREKIPSMMQQVSDANWSMTKKSIDDQVKDVEDRLGKLEKRL